MAKREKKVKAKNAKTVKVKSENGGDVIDRSKYKYERHEVKLADGSKKKVRDNNDRIAQAMRPLDTDTVVKAVKTNGGEVKDSWSKLNAGMRRMAAGNALRAIVRSGKTVVLGDKRVASLGD